MRKFYTYNSFVNLLMSIATVVLGCNLRTVEWTAQPRAMVANVLGKVADSQNKPIYKSLTAIQTLRML
ncbi:hypothetical protein CI610_02214 [invertebrate metagenome]|uniref:Uncharacterized protein n=1 Tax=invertebrate metagenome TaxID=1711999 RepID=A0A2H9T6J5_9ZZZZ